MEGPAVKRQRLLSGENSQEKWTQWFSNLEVLETRLLSGCLCNIETLELQRPLISSVTTISKEYTYQFISTISLLCEVALKQQNGGFICSKLSEMASAVSNDPSIWDILLEFIKSPEKYLSFVTSKCLTSFLLFTSLPQVDQIFEELFAQLILGSSNPQKLSNILETISSVIEYKDDDEHPLDLESGLAALNQSCKKVEVDLAAVESEVKTICIKALENWWTRVLAKFKNLILNFNSDFEYSIVSFLTLWHTIISVKSNLSVIDTKHFYLNVEGFVALLTSALPAMVWKKILDIFNEILCYGSTLSLQDSPPEEACNLAHLVIRCVKSRQFLQGLPYTKGVFYSFGGSSLGPVDWECESDQKKRRILDHQVIKASSNSASSVVTAQPSTSTTNPKPTIRNVVTSTIYIGPVANALNLDDLSINDSESCNGDTPLLQKLVLLILKCVAVTVMETRDDESDSSDSGSGASDDEDSSHSASESETTDMIIIEKSIREVFQHLDQFVKALVPFHPSTPVAEWIVKLFSDQDDVLMEGMLCTLDTFSCFLGRIQIPKDFCQTLNPILTFITFTGTISEDKDTLLDLLMSNETCFLLYLLRFLKFSWKNWPDFVVNCGCNLEKTMSLLIRLRMALGRLVEKSLFPYNINPVLRLLEKCEERYESSPTADNNTNGPMAGRNISSNST